MGFEYVYEDDIVKEPAIGLDGKADFRITAKNRRLFKNCPIEHDTTTGKCKIFSNKPIDGLTLIKQEEGQTPKKSIVNKTDIETTIPMKEVA